MSLLRRVVNQGGFRRGGTGDRLGQLVTLAEPDSYAAETYRTLRTNLLYGFVDDPPRTLVLTSPGRGDGKSTTCANLGVVLAHAGKNTLILDCDMHSPAIHKIFGLRNVRGLVDVLVNELSLPEAWLEPLDNLQVIPVGAVPFNPAELLGSRRFAELLRQARGEFDYVLIDAPPVQLVSDPIILASQVDGVLLVIDAQNTRKGAVRRSIRSLEAVGANVLGTVMNDVKMSGQRYYRYGYVST